MQMEAGATWGQQDLCKRCRHPQTLIINCISHYYHSASCAEESLSNFQNQSPQPATSATTPWVPQATEPDIIVTSFHISPDGGPTNPPPNPTKWQPKPTQLDSPVGVSCKTGVILRRPSSCSEGPLPPTKRVCVSRTQALAAQWASLSAEAPS